jgi:hypothetical protein
MKPALPLLPVRLRNCAGVLVDSNVLLDLATQDATWGDWSRRALAECADRTKLVINPIVYAEISVGFATIEALNAALPAAVYARAALPWEAGFLAGKCFWRTGAAVDRAPRPFRTSISECMPQLSDWRSLRAIRQGTEPIFLQSKFSRLRRS